MAAEFDLIETALKAGTVSWLATAFTAPEIVDVLRNEGPFTVFAPTDDAFARVPTIVLDALLQPHNTQTLISILRYHVVQGRLTVHEVANLDSVITVQGEELKIERRNGLKINDAVVVTPDVEASNGMIHIIDAVLMPAVSGVAL